VPKPRAPQIDAWSYSRWRTYDDCPARARYTYVDKLATGDDDSPALARGSRIHAGARDFVVLGGDLPEDLERFADEFAILRRAWEGKLEDVLLEEQWAFDRDWNPVEWFAPSAWARVVLDALVADWPKRQALVVDHKTGRVRPEGHESQLSLYALAVLSRYADVDRVHATLWYLDHGVAHGRTYLRAQLDDLRKGWLGRVEPMLSDRTFEPRPSDACRWCPFSKSKEGPCRY